MEFENYQPEQKGYEQFWFLGIYNCFIFAPCLF